MLTRNDLVREEEGGAGTLRLKCYEQLDPQVCTTLDAHLDSSL